MTWHIVYSQGGVILGVFGAALLSEAQECARRVERQTGFPAIVKQIKGDRPSVGELIPKGERRTSPTAKAIADLSKLRERVLELAERIKREAVPGDVFDQCADLLIHAAEGKGV